jgi:hypothetical protein
MVVFITDKFTITLEDLRRQAFSPHQQKDRLIPLLLKTPIKQDNGGLVNQKY